jgi:hypothetical protein
MGETTSFILGHYFARPLGPEYRQRWIRQKPDLLQHRRLIPGVCSSHLAISSPGFIGIVVVLVSGFNGNGVNRVRGERR